MYQSSTLYTLNLYIIRQIYSIKKSHNLQQQLFHTMIVQMVLPPFCTSSIFSFSQSSQLDVIFHSFELHLAFILSHKHHFSLVWLFSCLKSPKKNEQLEVKNHTYSLPILYPQYTPGRDSIVFFLMEWNRNWVKTQNQEETWVLQDGGRWSHLGKASWQREAGLATGTGRRCGLGQCGQEEWGRHGSQAAPPALSRTGSRPSG